VRAGGVAKGILMKLVTALEAARDIRGLQPSALCRRGSRKVAHNRDKDMPLRVRVDPFVELTPIVANRAAHLGAKSGGQKDMLP